MLAKSPVATDQTRQYFRNVFIQGSIDFTFGNATAVFDQANSEMTT
ncbi:pectinesterase family protein [Streptomyces sp. B1-3]